MTAFSLIRCPFCGNESVRDITTDFRIRMAKENPHDQTQDFDVRFYHCNKCSRGFESTEAKAELVSTKEE